MSVLRKRSVESILEEARKKTFNPTMKTLDLVLFGIGAIIGSGILVLTGKASAEAGPAVVFSFLIAGLACCLAALCYAELASTETSYVEAKNDYRDAAIAYLLAKASLAKWVDVPDFDVNNRF